MGKINQKELNKYVNRLYLAELKRYKEKLNKDPLLTALSFFDNEEKRRRRVSPTKSQKKKVREIYHYKCAVCGKPYDEYDFEYHHIDGDPSHTAVSNLVLLCHSCHRRITDEVRAKLKDYKVRSKRKSAKVRVGIELPEFKPHKPEIPKIKTHKLEFPKVEFPSLFDEGNKRKTRGKKKSRKRK